MRRAMLAVAVAVVSLFSVAALGQAGTCSGMTVGQLTSLNGFVPFPSDNLWNKDISALPVDPNSANIINFIGSTVTLHPDFGSTSSGYMASLQSRRFVLFTDRLAAELLLAGGRGGNIREVLHQVDLFPRFS